MGQAYLSHARRIHRVRDHGAGYGREIHLSTTVATALEEYCAEILQGARNAEQVESASPSGRVSVLFDQREELSNLSVSSLDALVSLLLTKVRWHLHELNQFVVPSEDEIAHLRPCLRYWLRVLHEAMKVAVTAAECEAMMVPANQALLAGLNSVMVPHTEPTQPKIISEEYSVEIQLEILHLNPELLDQPVLDIGCGREAALVLWLRQRKINAIGVDAFADSASGCMKADWLKFPYLPDKFGTITAHLSFSLHFLHQHLRSDGEARTYAITYMSILRSLRRGGLFAYAPGLPFIEQVLPADQYKVEKYPIERVPLDQRATEFFEQRLGESPIYASQVVRL